MKADRLSSLPPWRDDFITEEGEEWKPNPTRDLCKQMYEQWDQVMMMLEGVLEILKVKESEDSFSPDYWEMNKAALLGDGFLVGVKIHSSESGLYMIRMENASIIRKEAQHIKSSMLLMISEEVIEESHGMAIRNEIDKFRELFKQWVASFQRDEFEDEWGLFN